MSSKKRVTINDVAMAAGVSKTTVSRYINGHPELMSEKTRERIRTVIEMTNYHPSDIASNLKKRTTNLIGLLIADISSPFSSALINGASKFLDKRGYTLLIADSADDLEKEKHALSSLWSKGVSGVLVNTTSYSNNFLIQVLCGGLPVVLCDRQVRDYNFDIVTTDQHEAMFHLLNHLKQQGYTRPLFLVEPWENNSVRMKRREAFLEIIHTLYGYDASEDVYMLKPGGESAVQVLQRALGRNNLGIPAVIGCNSITTVRAFHAIQELGLSIPEEIGLCGPEDWDWSNEMNWPFIIAPNITTVKIPATQIGSRAAALLLEKLEGPECPPKEILLPCVFYERASTIRMR